MPMHNDEKQRLETSVFRTSGLNRSEVKALSKMARKDKGPYAAGHVAAKDITNKKVSLEPDNIPERHASIIGWPATREDQMEIARDLANSSELEKYR